MVSSHQFGGHWTEEKLSRLKKYLSAYTTIFKGNPKAAFLKTTFVDAFAGTGYRNISTNIKLTTPIPLLDEVSLDDEDARSLQKGSAQIALETNPTFDNYMFIEKRQDYAQELARLRWQFPTMAQHIQVIQGEANSTLKNWCQHTDWRSNRAVVFLDPYGMQVEWSTIVAIAQTQAIDLWLLFPLGQAVNRVLKKNSPPEGAWADRLTIFFGTSDWKETFYKPRQQMSLFDEEEILEKETNFEEIGSFFVNRLTSVFAKVAENPLPLLNSKNVPIYLLCFAASNPKGASTAVKIAQYILNQ